MANTPTGTVLNHTVDIIKNLLTSGNKVEADQLGGLISDYGDRLLVLKQREESGEDVGSFVRSAAPVATTVEETKSAEAPATTTQVATQLPAAEPEKRRGRKPAVQSEVKRKPGRPKGTGKKARETAEAEAVSEVSTGEVISPTDDTQTEMSQETPILEFSNPDPRAPDYKFKHLLDRFGVNPDGTAKRFNNLTEDETFDGELVISLFDGVTRKMLKRHLGTVYDMSPKEYNTHFGLSKDYRPVGRDFSQSKSVDAKKTKLGHKADNENEVETAAEQPIATPAPTKAVRRTRARSTQAA